MAHNTDNLKPLDKASKADAKAIRQKGQKAMIETKRKRKTFKEAYLAIADKPFKPIGTLASEIQDQYKGITVQEAISIAMTVKASNGDVQAATYLRDTIGEKPTDKMELSGEVNNPYKELTSKELKNLAKK